VFTQVGGVPLSAEILYFTKTSPPRLVAYDVVEQSPVSGSLTLRRHLVTQEFGQLLPSPPPSLEGPSQESPSQESPTELSPSPSG